MLIYRISEEIISPLEKACVNHHHPVPPHTFRPCPSCKIYLSWCWSPPGVGPYLSDTFFMEPHLAQDSPALQKAFGSLESEGCSYVVLMWCWSPLHPQTRLTYRKPPWHLDLPWDEHLEQHHWSGHTFYLWGRGKNGKAFGFSDCIRTTQDTQTKTILAAAGHTTYNITFIHV